MSRFRPNLVIEGAVSPFVEDGWRHLQIGEVEARLADQILRGGDEVTVG